MVNAVSGTRQRALGGSFNLEPSADVTPKAIASMRSAAPSEALTFRSLFETLARRGGCHAQLLRDHGLRQEDRFQAEQELRSRQDLPKHHKAGSASGHAGVIDMPMYERLLTADLVIADLSTANINAFFELGVRYALRPKTTIVIAENNLEMGFDMGHVVIRKYEHLGPGIDSEEVERVKAELTKACREIQTEHIDSPGYTFLTDLAAPSRGLNVKAVTAIAERQREDRTREALAQATTKDEKAALEQLFAALMKTARDAKARGDFRTMRDVLRGVRAVQGDKADPDLVQQLGLGDLQVE